jgi:hypothetical protein
MKRIERTRTVSRVAVVVVAVAAVALGASAYAGHLAGDVKSYTGCLGNGGQIVKLKEGDAPSSSCAAGQTQVHLSGGDITAVSAGTGLTGGGDNGGVSLGVAPTYRLPQGCAGGQVAKWLDDAWVCAADDDTRNAELLDGLDSSAFVVGTGTRRVAVAHGASFDFATADSKVTYTCGAQFSSLTYETLSPDTTPVWYEVDGQISFVTLPSAGSRLDAVPVGGGTSKVTFTATHGPRTVQAEVYSSRASSACVVKLLAFVTST